MSTTFKVTLLIPGALRDRCRGSASLTVEAATVGEALERIEAEFPDLHRGIRDETGRVRRHVNLFVNSDNVRDLEGLDTSLAPGDVVTILPAVSGG